MSIKKRTYINSDEELVVQGKLTVEGEFVQKDTTIVESQTLFDGNSLVVNQDGDSSTASLVLKTPSNTAVISYTEGGNIEFSQPVAFSGSIASDITGNAGTATALQTGRNFSITGDGIAPAINFDGTAPVALNFTLVNTGVSATTYGLANSVPQFTVDLKGRLTNASDVLIDIDSSQVSDFTQSVRSNISASGNITYNSNTGVIGASLTTTDITEGDNLYYTDTRSRDAISVTAPLTYNSNTGVLGVNISSIGPDTTDDLTEGNTNLYFTVDRVRSNISASGNITYDANTGVIGESLTTTDIDEGDNLYFTESRARDSVSAGTGVTYSNASGVFSIGQPVEIDSNVTFDGIFANTLTVSSNNKSITLDDNGFNATSSDGNSLSTSFTVDERQLAVSTTGDIILSCSQDMQQIAGGDYAMSIANTLGIFSGGNMTISSGSNLSITAQNFILGNNGDIVSGGNIIASSFTGNVFGSVTGQVSDISNHDTDALSEGTSNLYFTPERVRGNISGSGNITYDANTGVIGESLTTTDIDEGDNLYFTNARVNAYITDSITTSEITEGSNLYFTNARVDAHLFAGAGEATFNENVLIEGDLTVLGNVDYVTVADLLVENQSIVLNVGNAAAQDAFIQVDRSGSSLSNVELKWNETLDRWEFTNDGNVYYPLPTSTTDLAEGANLYYTDSRARQAISATGNITYDANTGVIGESLTTTDIDEGDNLYYTDERVNSFIQTSITTTDIDEGSNLYFTVDRVRSNISASGNITYDANTGVIGESLTTTDIDEGDNLYYTDSRARQSISTSGNITYDANTGVIGESLTTTDIDEGDNLYYTDARVNSFIQTSITTTDIDEGDNQYYTTDRANSAMDAYLTSTTANVDSVNGQTGVVVLDTDDVAEGSNLYYTDQRVEDYLSGNTGIDYANGVISVDNTVVTTTGNFVLEGNIQANGSLRIPTSPSTLESAVYVEGSAVFAVIDGNAVALTSETTVGTILPLGSQGIVTVISVGDDFGARRIDGGNSITVTENSNVISVAANIASIREQFSAATSGLGSLSYNDTTGVFTYAGPDSATIRGLLSGSGLISYNSSTGEISTTADNYASWNIATESNVDYSVTSGETLTIQGGTNITVTNSGNVITIANDNDADITQVIAGTGLTGGGSSGAVTLNVNLGDFTTDDLAEGNANLYYSDSKARQAISATGNITYDANTGVIGESLTTTDIDEGDNLYYTDSRARDSVSAGTGVTYSNVTGIISIGQAVETDSNVTFDTVSLQGLSLNANVGGKLNTVAINENGFSMLVEDTGNVTSTAYQFLDNGFSITGSGNATFSFSNFAVTGNGQVTANSFVGNLTGNVTGDVTGQVSDISNHTTDDLAEGSANLYFTSDRVRSNISVDGDLVYDQANGVISFTERTDSEVRGLISAGGDLSYNSSTGVISFTERTDSEVRGLISATGDISYNNTTGVISFTERTDAEVRGLISAGGDLSYDSNTGVMSYTTPTTIASLSNHDTDDLTEGNTNLYFTVDRVRSNISASGNITYDANTGVIGESLTTTDIDEGDNLYYTNARVNAFIQDSITTTDIDEGTNLYYTNARVDAHLLAGAGEAVFTSDVTVQGNLEVTGNVNYVTVEDLLVRDHRIVLNFGNAAAQDAFITVDRSGSSLSNTEIKWNEASDRWEFTNDGVSYYPLPTSTTDLEEGSNLYYTNARVNAYIQDSITTTDIDEGSNLYYTDSRARAAISGSGNITYDANTGVIGESLTTTDIDEGDNLYFTEQRARDSISSTGNITYDANTGIISENLTTDDVTEGNNLYYTDQRVEDYLSSNISTLNSDTIEANAFIGGTFSGDGSDLTDVRAKTLEVVIKNVTLANIVKGTPVHQVGFTGSGTFEVVPADASNAALMPAHFIAGENLDPDEEGRGFVLGKIDGVDTSSFVEGDVIYVAAGGGYANVPPTGEGNLVQNLGIVTRVDATQGGGEILNPGSVEGTPNLNQGNIFLGDISNRAVTATLNTSIVPESGNLYYTDARARDAVSADTSTGIDYNVSTGQFFLSNVPNDSITNSSITVNGVTFDLGDTNTVTANTTQTLTRGVYLTGNDFNGGTATTWAVDATPDNVASKVVARDANGSFAANVVTATATQAQYADLAENYQADSEYEPGTVLIIGGDAEVTTTNKYCDTRVAGVVSTDPAHLMNSKLKGNKVVAVALRGRVPVKVMGPVHKGDVLVTSDKPGYACAAADPDHVSATAVVGKALGNHSASGSGVVEVMV